MCGTHFNCILDGVFLQSLSQRHLHSITSINVREKQSYNQLISGFFMRMTNCIPITRPMDRMIKGKGRVLVNEDEVQGENTSFTTEVNEGDLIAIDWNELRVKKILSDEKLIINQKFIQKDLVSYKIHPRIDNSQSFESIIDDLQNGFGIGIFPEGDTHEEPEMLPLKGGIATLILQCLEKGVNPHIQCFSYFISSPAKFRNKTELILVPSFQFDVSVKDLSKEQAYHLIIQRITDELQNVMLPVKTVEQVELGNFIGKVAEMKDFKTNKIECLRNILNQVKAKGCGSELTELMKIIKSKASELRVSKYSVHEVTETEFCYNLVGGLILTMIVMNK